MAQSSPNIDVLSRSAGRNALQFASYCTGKPLYDEQLEKLWEKQIKPGETVEHSEILAPKDAPSWVYDTEQLWNRVERAEWRRKHDAQVARIITVPLARELSDIQHVEALREVLQKVFVEKGMVVQFSIHHKTASDGLPQPHAHIMMTMRDITPEGEFHYKKNRDWNKTSLNAEWRKEWKEKTNSQLKEVNAKDRIDLRSYKERGIDRLPTKHLGPKSHEMEKKGIRSREGDHNRTVKHINKVKEMRENKAQLEQGSTAGRYLMNTKQPERMSETARARADWEHYANWRANVPRYGLEGSPSADKAVYSTRIQTLLNGMLVPFSIAATAIGEASRALVKIYDKFRDAAWQVFDKLMQWDEPERRAEMFTKQEQERGLAR